MRSFRPELRTDGMFLVGLDVVGDKLMDVFRPGGLGLPEPLRDELRRDRDRGLEYKVDLRTRDLNGLSNATVATL